MELCPLLMILGLNAALQNKIGKKLIEYQHGLNSLDKILKIYYLRQFFGTQRRLINSRTRDRQSQSL